MSELHEILAVEQSLAKTSDKLCSESKRTLAKPTLFQGVIRDLTMFDQAMKHENTHEEQELTTTVDENLEYIFPHIKSYWDCVLMKDATNQIAKADIVINDVVLAENVPATFLLGMESKLASFRKVLEDIPTLAPGIKWTSDPDAKKGAFKTEVPTESFKTEKQIEFRIVTEPTQYHPAEIRELHKNANVGKYITQGWSGTLTPANKADKLNRLDTLLHAVKRARQRANKADIVKRELAMDLINYIYSGDLP